ncbi:consortin isoform X2 [Mastacembelus armatus]|uniref:consortin isoform X2 n=1 Tax=Mastacembelus armatus TaxID=205130 RepID=UPI000E464180|nr:consortin isoform X2 [Mastacembelus armatus]XP_026149767.1 consortin isoform X2 [Mastacembelus armatus]
MLMQSLSLLQTGGGGGHRPTQKTSLNNNGKDNEKEQGKEVYTGRGRKEDEEEDIDEVMGEEEEKEESEESSSLIGCQSPDTPMNDSSYSETGSLLEAQFLFTPGTSPEPNTPVIPMVSPVEFSQSDADCLISNTKSLASATESFTLGLPFTTQSVASTATVISDMRSTSSLGSTCITGTMDRINKNISFATEHLIPSTKSIFNHEPTCLRGPACSYTESVTSAAEAFAVTTSTLATTGPLTFSTGPMTTGTKSTSTTGPINSNRECITSMPVPACFALSTCSTGPIPRPAPMESLEQLTQKGDDAHFPQYLHQIAETFVLQEDYQWALWCIQLERLYHQRLLENLNALQKQWEKQCRNNSSDLKIQHLETLKDICLTHSRPRARDAVCASLDCLMSTFEESGALPAYTSVHQVRGMEQRSEDPFYPQSGHAVIPSNNVADSTEVPSEDCENPDRELDERDNFHRSQLTDKECSDRERAEAEVACSITVLGNVLHPSRSGEMDQSNPAEQQGGDLVPALEKEAKREEEDRGVEAAGPLEMKDEEEEEEEEKQKEKDYPLCQKALKVQMLVSGAEVEVQQLHQEAFLKEKLHEETQEAHPPQEAHMKQQEQGEEEEEEEEYEVQQADIIRDAASLDDMAKLITVEEISPASGLVSILKKRDACVDSMSVSGRSEPSPDKPTAKRRVRFKVPEDSYEYDVGGGDSCLLLFLLCLVTVVISVGGTALYCALGDAHSSVCQDFSRNADFYIGQIQRGISQILHWLTPG